MAVNTYIHTPVNYVELEDKTDELEVNQQVYLQTKNNRTMCKRTKTNTSKKKKGKFMFICSYTHESTNQRFIVTSNKN